MYLSNNLFPYLPQAQDSLYNSNHIYPHKLQPAFRIQRTNKDTKTELLQVKALFFPLHRAFLSGQDSP